MAITQKDIIQQIPRVIHTSRHKYMDCSGDALLILRSLIATGWGQKCNIHQVVDELLTLAYTDKGATTYIFDKKTLKFAPLVCSECYDLGYLFNDNSPYDLSTYPCPKCQKDRGELGQIVDAIKVYKKKLGAEVFQTDFNQRIKNILDKSSLCVSVQIRLFKLITAISLKERPLTLLNFAEWDLLQLPLLDSDNDECPF